MLGTGRVTEIEIADESSSGSWTDMRRIGESSSRMSLVDAMERRTQRTYRYGIGLVCIGATLNWLGFAQGHGYVDPLRYLGVACVISGSFCVCTAMCRWFGRPFSLSYSERLSRYTDDGINNRRNGDVHVINISVPVNHPNTIQRPTKPPDYESTLSVQPPSYDEAIKLSPISLNANANSNSNSNITNTNTSETLTTVTVQMDKSELVCENIENLEEISSSSQEIHIQTQNDSNLHSEIQSPNPNESKSSRITPPPPYDNDNANNPSVSTEVNVNMGVVSVYPSGSNSNCDNGGHFVVVAR